MSSASDSESDIEMSSRLPQVKIRNIPKSPDEHLRKEPKKIKTKDMIHKALEELKSRKGVSLHAIKKYMVANYNVDTDKINFYIKKYIKNGVQDGTIIQVKGVGASGSFRLAPVNKEVKKPKIKKAAKPDKPKENIDKTEKEKADKAVKAKSGKKTVNEIINKPEKKTKDNDQKKPKAKVMKETKKEKISKEPKKEKVTKESKKGHKIQSKVAEITPDKKNILLMKRKSIGSIIKPPKMRPKKRD